MMVRHPSRLPNPQKRSRRCGWLSFRAWNTAVPSPVSRSASTSSTRSGQTARAGATPRSAPAMMAGLRENDPRPEHRGGAAGSPPASRQSGCPRGPGPPPSPRSTAFSNAAPPHLGHFAQCKGGSSRPSGRQPWLAVRSLLGCSTSTARVRNCANPDCPFWFLDTTRSGTRCWCSMTVCGNRLKARRHYRRQHPG